MFLQPTIEIFKIADICVLDRIIYQVTKTVIITWDMYFEDRFGKIKTTSKGGGFITLFLPRE